jgi:hypothetical protein
MTLSWQALINEYRQRLDYLRSEIEARAEEQPSYAEHLRDIARNYELRIRELEQNG